MLVSAGESALPRWLRAAISALVLSGYMVALAVLHMSSGSSTTVIRNIMHGIIVLQGFGILPMLFLGFEQLKLKNLGICVVLILQVSAWGIDSRVYLVVSATIQPSN